MREGLHNDGGMIRASVGIGSVRSVENEGQIQLTPTTVLDYLYGDKGAKLLGFPRLMAHVNDLDSSQNPPANRPGKRCRALLTDASPDNADFKTRQNAKESLFALAQALNLRGKGFTRFMDNAQTEDEVDPLFAAIETAGLDETNEIERLRLKRDAALRVVDSID